MVIPVPDLVLNRDSFKASRSISREAYDQQTVIMRRVGTLISIWANVETAFIALLERMLGTSMQNTLIVFYSIKNNRSRMELLRALVKENLSGTRQAKALKLIDRFKAPSSLRNDFAHCEYAIDPASQMLAGTISSDIRRAGSGKGVGQFRPFDRARLNEIDHCTGEMLKLVDEIWQLCRAIDDAAQRAEPAASDPPTPEK